MNRLFHQANRKGVAIGLLCLAGLWSEAGLAEERVVVLTSYPQETISLFEAAFEKSNPGVKVEIVWRMPHDAIGYLTEPGSHGVDVYWSASARNYTALADSGRFAPLTVNRMELPDHIGDFRISDERSRYVASEVAAYGFICNSAKMSQTGKSCPRKWTDLADASLDRQVLLPIASKVGFSPLMYDILLQRLGWEAGWSLLSEIAGNSELFVPGGAFITDRVANGDQAVGVTIDFFARSAIANGMKVEFFYPDVLGFSPAHVAMLHSAPHPAQARLFIDFLLSDQGQRILASPEVRKLPVRPSAYALLDSDYFNPFKAAGVQSVSFDLPRSLARQPVVNALFDVLITDRHEALRELWRNIHRVERLAAERSDKSWLESVSRARAAAGWVPVRGSEADNSEVQRNHAAHHNEWAREVDSRRTAAMAELVSIISRAGHEGVVDTLARR